MNWSWLISLFAGLSVGIIIGVLIDRDTLIRYGKVTLKIRGRGNTVSDMLKMDPEDLPPGITPRQIRKLERMKRRLKK